MLVEIASSVFFGSLALKAYMSKRGNTSNDSGKIQKIISLSGLNVKDGSKNKTLTTQLIRKKKHDWGWSYHYRLPLGRSFDDYQRKWNVIEDGLNSRRKRITFEDLKELQFDSNIIGSLRSLWGNKLMDKKEIELAFDGLLIIRVYDKPLPTNVPFEAGDGWKIPVGITREKNAFRYHDFERIPHMVMGGSSGYGKSVFINSMLISLLKSKPEHVNLFLIDLKGGVELCDYADIKQTVSIAYEPEEALETLRMAYEKMKEIQIRLRLMGKKNVQEAGIKERYFVIIDEAGELNPTEGITQKEKDLKKECQTIMSQIARIGRSNGFRQILATQYPVGDCLPRQVKNNSDAKLCFRVQSEVASRVVLDSEGAESLPQIRGRAIYQMADKREILQTPLITENVIIETLTPFKVDKIVKEEAKIPLKPMDNVIRFIPVIKEGKKVEKTEQPRRENIVTFKETGLSDT